MIAFALSFEHLIYHLKYLILSLVDILIMIAKLSCHLVNNLFENHRVNILPQHVQQEPVPHLCLLDDDVDALLLDQPEPDIEQVRLKNQ